MTDHIDPQQLQIIEHKERLLRERLRHVNSKQYDLLQEEGSIRNELQLVENQRFNLLQH